MKQLGIGIIGAGAVSDYHHVPAIELDPRARVAGVCDANEDLAKNKAQKWQAPFVTSSTTELCENEEIDAVIIATPNDTHKEIAIEAAKAGKHIMCETPKLTKVIFFLRR